MSALDDQLLQGNEAQRLAAVRRYDILDTPPDGSFDRIAAIAAKIFATPISIISLVDHDRIWFKSHIGLDATQIGRDPGLCASAILQTDPWILTDAKHDMRALANPLVAGEFGLRFYAGVPLRTSDGFNLGTLCVIDREPRIGSQDQIRMLQDLASVVMDQMELRLSSRRAVSELSDAVVEKDNALRRSELMAQEIDHRVKNGLQVVSSLLSVQSRALGDTEAAEQLNQASNRVLAISRVHEHIYKGHGIESSDCNAYFQRVCDDLSQVLGRQHVIALEAIEAQLPTERIVSLGLILNELVMNAAKHGGSKIAVKFERPSGAYSLSVSDDGVGFPVDFDPASVSGLGMKVIRSLAEKIGANLIFTNAEDSRGAKCTVLLSG